MILFVTSGVEDTLNRVIDVASDGVGAGTQAAGNTVEFVVDLPGLQLIAGC